MENYAVLLIAMLVTLIAAFAYLALELSSLKDDVRRMYMNSVSEYTVNDTKRMILTEMNDQFDKVLTEIACLATKNNADIQRVKEGYKPGDVIEYNSDQYVVLKRKSVVDELSRVTEFYRLCRLEDGDVYTNNRDDVDKNSKFLRHVDLLLEEPVL